MSSINPALFGGTSRPPRRTLRRVDGERLRQRVVLARKLASERFAAEESVSLAAPTEYDARGFPIPQRRRGYFERIDRLLGRLD